MTYHIHWFLSDDCFYQDPETGAYHPFRGIAWELVAKVVITKNEKFDPTAGLDSFIGHGFFYSSPYGLVEIDSQREALKAKIEKAIYATPIEQLKPITGIPGYIHVETRKQQENECTQTK